MKEVIPLFINIQKPCRYKDVEDGKGRATIHTLGQALIGNRTEALKPPINLCFISPSLYAVSRTTIGKNTVKRLTRFIASSYKCII